MPLLGLPTVHTHCSHRQPRQPLPAAAAGVALPILALTLGHVFSNAVRTLPAVAADVLSRDFGLTPEGLAAITGAFPAAFAVAMIPVGVALDRWGVRRTALVLLAIGVCGSLLASLAVGPGMLFVAVPGSQTDGRRFIGQAVAQGAAAVLAPLDTTDAIACREESSTPPANCTMNGVVPRRVDDCTPEAAAGKSRFSGETTRRFERRT